MSTLQEARDAKVGFLAKMLFSSVSFTVGITSRDGEYGLSVGVYKEEDLDKIPSTIDNVSILSTRVVGTVKAQNLKT